MLKTTNLGKYPRVSAVSHSFMMNHMNENPVKCYVILGRSVHQITIHKNIEEHMFVVVPFSSSSSPSTLEPPSSHPHAKVTTKGKACNYFVSLHRVTCNIIPYPYPLWRIKERAKQLFLSLSPIHTIYGMCSPVDCVGAIHHHH